MFPRTETGIAGDLSPVREARPVAHFPAQHFKGQGPDSPRDLSPGALFLNGRGHRLLLGLHRLNEAHQRPQALEDPGGGLLADAPPRPARPPLAGDVDAVRGQQAASPRQEALALAHNLPALPGEGPVALAGDADAEPLGVGVDSELERGVDFSRIGFGDCLHRLSGWGLPLLKTPCHLAVIIELTILHRTRFP